MRKQTITHLNGVRDVHQHSLFLLPKRDAYQGSRCGNGGVSAVRVSFLDACKGP
jgi:hypothetical protein